ncbi:amidohydrolase family protein [Xylophilus rhododendri]|uniref:Amidohydrolase family protein n=1 Tax=Xylophilus rhododendri TaxID=2697032 RepID=A0A857J7J1_9BURK|nr:amidohydrolase family protein [Xylophilus rhododendri]QHI98755.1 amidohydrolase family protein [Xylophilus rhododendri]
MTRPCLPAIAQPSTPQLKLPAGACDSHAHVFGPYAQFPLAEDRSYTPAEYPPASFVEHLDQLGLARGVLVTASACGTDNGSVLAALQAYPQRLRGVFVADADTTEAELDAWHAAGVRGLRFNLYRHEGKAVYRNGVGLEVLQALAPRLAARGWHAQIWIHAPDLVELAPRLTALGVTLVVDHMGRMSAARGVADPGFQELCRLLAEGRAWTKISGADRNTAEGPPYRDIDPFAQALLAANDERVVWGTDWPHINYFDPAQMPDDGALVDLLVRWMPDAAQRQRVLVDNPAALYDFPPSEGDRA